MRRTWKPVAVIAAAALTMGLTTTTAHSETTDATFTLTAAGALGISVPASTVNLGSTTSGSVTFAPRLGDVTVTDDRNLLVAEWTATATGSHFDLQGTSATPSTDPDQRVLSSAVTYTAVPTVTGSGTATATAGTLGLGSTVVFAGVGSNQVTWNPTLTMTLLSTQLAGTYKGTITHSVS